MRIYLFLILIIASVFTPLWAQRGEYEKPVRVGVFSFEPINFIDPQGGVQGLYPDLLRSMVEEEGWSIEFVPGTWAQGLERLQANEIDLVTTIAHTPERAKVMDFNHEAVVSIWGQVFLRPGSKVEKILDLEGLKVAITERDISGQNFLKTIAGLGVNCEIIRYPRHDDVFLALKNKEVDAGVTPNYFGLRHFSEYGVVPSSIQFSPFSIYFATRKGQFAHLLEHIDEHLSAWKADKNSYYYQRLNYWMGGENFEKKIIPLWIWVCLGVVALTALVLFFASMAFKVQVRKATAERRSRERDYRRLVQSVNNIILRVDTQGKIQFINRYGLEFFGFDKHEIIGKSVLETIIPEQDVDGRDIQQVIKDVLCDPDDFENIENENICKDGQRVYIQWCNQAEYDEEGNIVGVFSVGADISERKRVEAELRAKEEKFRTLFEHVTDYALVLQQQDTELVIVDLSKSACRLHGYQREELLGQPLRLISPQSSSGDDSRQVLLRAGQTLKSVVMHQRKDGSTFPVEAVVRQIEVDGELYFFSIERDLTEQERAENERSELEKSLQQKYKMEAIGTLAGGIAHDFNNILAIILGNTQMLKRKLSEEDGNGVKLERILTAANRGKHLVDQVLAFSRRQEQSLQPLLLAELVIDTFDLLRASIPRTVHLETKVAPGCDELKVRADATQIQQVLLNLCNNAVFAMQEKGTITIELEKIDLPVDELFVASQLAAGEYLQLSVTDTGGGIRAENIEKIFDPFYTTKEIGQGTGLGLAVVHGIVQGHQGVVRVHSQRGEGSRFEICLPLTHAPIRHLVEDAGPLPTGSERILFVDDEEDITLWADELLKQQGFNPVCYTDSEDALERFQKDPQAFDMLITDQSMPILSGQELIAKVRELRSDIPVILCSGFSSLVSTALVEQQGINKFFHKPYREEELLLAIRKCLDFSAENPHLDQPQPS